MIKNKISPHDYFETRRLKHQSPHLSCIDLKFTYNTEKAMVKWIQNNLKHRYYLSKTVGITKENKIDTVMRVGFEDAKELSYFVLACPLLKYN